MRSEMFAEAPQLSLAWLQAGEKARAAVDKARKARAPLTKAQQVSLEGLFLGRSLGVKDESILALDVCSA